MIRLKGNLSSQTEDWIEDKALTVAKCANSPIGTHHVIAAANKTVPIGFKFKCFNVRFGHNTVCHKHIDRLSRTSPTISQERTLLRKRLGLNKHLVKGRMLPIGIVRRHGEFVIAGQIDRSCPVGPISK